MCRRLDLDPTAVALGLPWRGDALQTAQIDVVLLADAAAVADVVVPVAGHDGVTLCPVPTAVCQPIYGIDAEVGWTRLQAVVDPGEGAPVTAQRWDLAVAAGRLALAHELIGVGQAMLALAMRHVTDRTQFGVPLGTFQSVQHRLADVHVDLEAARAIARTAWVDGDPDVGAAAHLSALRAVETSTRHCHQVMGAIGCTWEHDMHRYMRRGVVLGMLLTERDATWSALVRAAGSARRTELFGS
jgi:alkylation response protein AidB-like acyl-CoA dehydrogenase